MSYPPPPGLNISTSNSQPHASLPARPPPSAVNPASSFKPTSNANTSKPAFTAFAPRSVASTNTFRTNSPAQYAAGPVNSYSAAPSYPQQDSAHQSSQQYNGSNYDAPQIRNPFVPTSDSSSSTNAYTTPSNYDPDYEAQVQQWQSAYMNKDDNRYTRSNISAVANPPPIAVTPRVETSSPAIQKDSTDKTVQRSGGGTTWSDSSLLEWDPAHFRIFVGNLAGEVTDESLLKAFSKYPSVQKARVIRDKRTTKSKGYGFVSFSDGDEYFQAAREMQGKYIGSHPILLKRSTTEVRATKVNQKGGKGGKYNHNKGGNNASVKTDYGGIEKKHPKTKGGLKVLG